MYKIGIMGGADDIGRSMLYIEYKNKAIVVDCGMEFPDELSSFGVNKIVSYGEYIKNNLHKIAGLFITHMHEDHIGGVRRFLEKYDKPIYAEPITCEFLKLKNSYNERAEFIPIKNNNIISLGPFSIRPFEVEHSTIKAFGYEIISDYGNLVISGDFKLGHSTEDAKERIKSWGIKEKPLGLLIESTNSDEDGFSIHEEDIIKNIEKLIKKYSEEIFIITTFSSNMERLKNIIQSAQDNQRDIFILGRNMEIATLFLIEQEIISKSRINFLSEDKCKVPDNALILTTGCQGEPHGGLQKLIEKLKDKEKKTVLFSSSIIPGNEDRVTNLKIKLLRNGFEYIEGNKEYHASGHARRDELKIVMEVLQPQYVIPVHGNYIKQIANKQNAIEVGVEEERVILVENNQLIKLGKEAYIVEDIEDSLEYITSNGISSLEHIENRRTIGRNGAFIYSIRGRYIKFSSIGIPENCRVSRVGRSFVREYLCELKASTIEEEHFREECYKYMTELLRGEHNIPYIHINVIPIRTRNTSSNILPTDE